MEKILTTTCSYDCGARCFLKVYIIDDKIVKILTSKKPIKSANFYNDFYNDKEKYDKNCTQNRTLQHNLNIDEHNIDEQNIDEQYNLIIPACPKGLSQDEVFYSKDRILEPLLRIGKRGEGKFKKISWNEAIEIVSEKLNFLKKNNDTQSIYYLVNTGSLSVLHNSRTATNRFFSMLGKCTTFWGNVSFEAALQSSIATFGTPYTGSTRDNLLYSKSIILWGFNPLISRFGSDTIPTLKQLKAKKIKIIGVDPRKSYSIEKLADQWISIKPGTDTAMLIAMAYVIVSENLHDKDFIEKYTFGFDIFKNYLYGKEDGVQKSPEWAEKICLVDAEDIRALARNYAKIKPAALITGWAPGRTLFGEQFHRAASVLSAITGNIGIKGGFVAGGADLVDMGNFKETIPVPEVKHNLIHKVNLFDAVLYGKQKGYPADCKILYIVGCNLLNQYLNLNKGRQALLKPEFIVLHELFLTPTTKFADLIFPVSHFFEREDIGQPWLGGPYLIYMNKIAHLGNVNKNESEIGAKSDLEIFTEIAKKIGMKNYNDKSHEEWLKSFLKQEENFPDFDTLKKEGIFLLKGNKPHIAFEEQIKDIKKCPFNTPSGKIEIYSNKFKELKNPMIPAIPKYIEFNININKYYDSLAYPICLISPHSPARVNSQLKNIKKLKKLEDDAVWINIKDAKQRNIKNGDFVLVFNNYGKIKVRAKVTDKIIKGTASLDQGRWFELLFGKNVNSSNTKEDMEIGGCVNVLYGDFKSPAGAFPSNTCFVEIKSF